MVDPLICGYFSIVNMILLTHGPWLIEPGSVEQPQIRKADYKLHVDPRVYCINACWVTERPNLITDDCPKLSAPPRGYLGWGAGRGEDGVPAATLWHLLLDSETRVQGAVGPRAQGSLVPLPRRPAG